ncbi:MAG: phage portal protein [Clostridia bacterium]|nr:phage portal protein [Clostridia bacterium]
MSWFKKKRAEVKKVSLSNYFIDPSIYQNLCDNGYSKISDNAEVQICVNKIADLISNMTIKMMENAENGNKRIKDGLSRKMDINPNNLMTRKNFIFHIVKTMFLYGDGNCICFPHFITKEGKVLLDNIDFFDMSQVTYNKSYTSYSINYKGKEYFPDEVLHFVLIPSERCPFVGKGYSKIAIDTINTLKQAGVTKKGFMGSKFMPNVIIKVDGTTEELSTEDGRNKILNSYIENTEAGKPWIIPSSLMEVESIKPLSLQDLAINDSIKIDKKTVAKIFDVPGFLIGTDDKFDKDEQNYFVDTRIMGIAQNIQQEFTRKLLDSQSRFFEFNPRSIYAYNIKDLADIAGDWRGKGLMTGNEARDWIKLEPKEGLDELLVLENYIPTDKVGEQKKLNKEGGEENDEEK